MKSVCYSNMNDGFISRHCMSCRKNIDINCHSIFVCQTMSRVVGLEKRFSILSQYICLSNKVMCSWIGEEV